MLENLTQSERNLLYAVRDLARFRQEFFTDVVGGYLNLMQQLQVIRNTERNIELIEEQVEIQKAVASQRPEYLREPLGSRLTRSSCTSTPCRKLSNRKATAISPERADGDDLPEPALLIWRTKLFYADIRY